MSKYKWTTEKQIKLVDLRNSPEWLDECAAASTNGQNKKYLWNCMANTFDSCLNGQEAKEKYNYLLKRYKKYEAESQKSGWVGVQWKCYQAHNEHFESEPSVKPTITLDTALEKEIFLKENKNIISDFLAIILSKFLLPIRAKQTLK